jgi:hypothetical protein
LIKTPEVEKKWTRIILKSHLNHLLANFRASNDNKPYKLVNIRCTDLLNRKAIEEEYVLGFQSIFEKLVDIIRLFV